ncbi:hypothetical protein [Sphingomonas sp.]|uniref:hypothetical protein n=1 Tax=Sphingomonas sp. TaxID=28214 RepID=UPI003AFFD9AB
MRKGDKGNLTRPEGRQVKYDGIKLIQLCSFALSGVEGHETHLCFNFAQHERIRVTSCCWEQNRARPDTGSRIYLQLIAADPVAMATMVARAGV